MIKSIQKQDADWKEVDLLIDSLKGALSETPYYIEPGDDEDENYGNTGDESNNDEYYD